MTVKESPIVGDWVRYIETGELAQVTNVSKKGVVSIKTAPKAPVIKVESRHIIRQSKLF